MKFQSNYIQLNEVKLHYIEVGNGEKVIIFLHGWPEFWYSWRKQMAFFAEKGFRVIVPDLRGFNLSEKPKNISDYAMENVRADIAQLMDKLNIEKANITGHDWGGAVAWHLATHYPNKVDKLAILNSPHPSIFYKHLKSDTSQLLKSWYMLFFQIPFLPEFFINLNLKQFFKNALRGWAINKNAFTDEDLNKYVEAYKQKGALKASINYYRAGLRFSNAKKSKGKKVQAPTLLIWGENDKALGKELTVGTENYINNTFELKLIPNCSHWVQQDEPEKVNEYLFDFFKTSPINQGEKEGG